MNGGVHDDLKDGAKVGKMNGGVHDDLKDGTKVGKMTILRTGRR